VTRRGRVLPRSFYRRDALELAPALLGKVLVREERGDDRSVRRCAGRIVEVEAYLGAADPGSHGYRGRTSRTATMFGPPGHVYVYFTYGMHWCANVVAAHAPDDSGAVLLRALAPLDGLDVMQARRPAARRVQDLCAGPARLCQAFAITGDHDGTDLTAGALRIVDDGTPPPADPFVDTRIGLSAGRGDDHPWRFGIPGDPHVSRPPRGDLASP